LVFMGSPAFATPSLEALHGAGYDVVGVVTQPDRPAGRGGKLAEPEVKRSASRLGLEVLQPATFKDADAVEAVRRLDPEVIVVAAYGKILPRSVLEIPARGCVNVHASLLPRWRGASPIAAAILEGDAETGVTIMEMVAKMDAGSILSQATTAIGPGETTGTLEGRLAAMGAELLVETLPRWLAAELTAREQDEAKATYCRTLSKEDGVLRRDMRAVEAERAVRAYDPWPGAAVAYGEGRLAIWRAHIAANGAAEAGTLSVVEGLPAIAFRDGWLVLDEVQRPGSRRMQGGAFLNGEHGRLAAEVGLA
jgi:methionyl-tRNA formyltransferase